MKNQENNYKIEFDEAAIKDLDSLTPKARKQISEAVKKLKEDPRSAGSKLKGYKNLYRLRTGDYRIVYAIEDDVLVILIIAVGPRKEIYDLLKRRTD